MSPARPVTTFGGKVHVAKQFPPFGVEVRLTIQFRPFGVEAKEFLTRMVPGPQKRAAFGLVGNRSPVSVDNWHSEAKYYISGLARGRSTLPVNHDVTPAPLAALATIPQQSTCPPPAAAADRPPSRRGCPAALPCRTAELLEPRSNTVVGKPRHCCVPVVRNFSVRIGGWNRVASFFPLSMLISAAEERA